MINFVHRFIPKKDYIALLLLGYLIQAIAFVLLGSITIPTFDIIYPKIFPSITAEILFFGLSDIPYLQHVSKI